MVSAHPKFLAQIMRHEGTKKNSLGQHIAYRCTAGALTIGYGHNLDANPINGINAGSAISEDRARKILTADLARYEKQLALALPWYGALCEPRQAVLLNMAFNLGVSGLQGFKSTLAAAEAGDYDNAASRMMVSRWAGQVGRRADELSKQMKTGEWQTA